MSISHIFFLPLFAYFESKKCAKMSTIFGQNFEIYVIVAQGAGRKGAAPLQLSP